MYTYKTKGTCSSQILIEVEGDIIRKVEFVNGCRGNTQGVARLAENRKIDEVIALCKGIECRGNTSCPDQLARALEEIRDGAKA
ncbi:MAG: TIGR03905 family TSCPD domain-containing protein [Clostridia bacterium]|nr:TIGR03905 family TSCPD domain-containing protein [Clostridia bacterium]